MPIISSIPALNSIVKGVGATFTLDKAELLLVPSVAADPYYNDQSNWKAVVLNYKSSTLTQPEDVGFDATQVSPTGIFNVVTQATDIFEIQSISIIDFQGGVFLVPRSELNVVDFDVDMSPASLYSRDFASPNTLQAYETTSGGSSVSGNLLNMVQGSEYANSDTSFVYVASQNYMIRIYVNAFASLLNGMDIKIGGTYITSATKNDMTNAVGSYFDIAFTPNAGQVANSERFKLEATASIDGIFSLNKVEIINA